MDAAGPPDRDTITPPMMRTPTTAAATPPIMARFAAGAAGVDEGGGGVDAGDGVVARTVPLPPTARAVVTIPEAVEATAGGGGGGGGGGVSKAVGGHTCPLELMHTWLDVEFLSHSWITQYPNGHEQSSHLLLLDEKSRPLHGMEMYCPALHRAHVAHLSGDGLLLVPWQPEATYMPAGHKLVHSAHVCSPLVSLPVHPDA
jgi:hypothetical protein